MWEKTRLEYGFTEDKRCIFIFNFIYTFNILFDMKFISITIKMTLYFL
jgi:hypothetical protein